MSRLFRKFILLIQYLLVLIFILFEELIWEGIAEPIYGYIHSLRLLQRLEGLLRRVNGHLILLIFVLLFAAVELAGIAAGILLVRGEVIYGVALYALKIPIAAFVFWLFRVTREKLLAFGWFRWSYQRLLALLEWVKALAVYRETLAGVHRIKARLRVLAQEFKKFWGEKRSGFSRRFSRLYRRFRKKS